MIWTAGLNLMGFNFNVIIRIYILYDIYWNFKGFKLVSEMVNFLNARKFVHI